MSTAKPCDVSIVIVNYNTEELLSGCLDSIAAQTKGLNYEVIVVDNASKDGSRRRVKTGYPWVVLEESPENLGFGRGNNRGARLARGKYLFLLNSDTVLLNNAVKELFDYCEREGDSVGVAGAWLRGRQGQPVNSYGIFPSYASCLASRVKAALPLKGKPITEGMTTTIRTVDCVTGADMFLRRELFEACGGFDEAFFMYYEETELQLRIGRKGYRQVLIPGPGIQHLEEGSKKSRMASRIMMETSVYRYFSLVRGPSLGLWAFAVAFMALSLVSNLRYPPRDFLSFYRSLGRDLPRILSGRRQCSPS